MSVPDLQQMMRALDELAVAFKRHDDRLRRAYDHLRWMAQTVHQAHHQDQPGSWQACPRGVCRETARLITAVTAELVAEIAERQAKPS